MSPDITYPITEAWITSVKLQMAVRPHYGQIELAQACGCSQAAISKVLRSPGRVSRLVGPISRTLDLPLPVIESASTESKAMLERYHQLDADGQKALLAHLDLLLKISAK